MEERLEDDAAMPARGADDAELELPRRDALDDRLRVGDGERDVHARDARLELAEQERNDDPGRARSTRRAASSPAELALALAGDVVEQLLLEREQPLRAA